MDWSETNTQHKLVIELLTEDGQPATTTGPFGPQAIRFEALAEAGRAVGMVRGTSVRLPLAMTIGAGLELETGVYQWRVSVDGFPDSTATETIAVQAAQQATPQQP